MGMMMLARLIMYFCGDYDSWDQRCLMMGMMAAWAAWAVAWGWHGRRHGRHGRHGRRHMGGGMRSGSTDRAFPSPT